VLAIAAFSCALGACIGGQTGSEGSINTGICEAPPIYACYVDGDCERQANAILAPLRTPVVGSPRLLVGAQCLSGLDCDDGRACSCQFERDHVVSELQLGGDGCALRGRSLACLWPAAELPVCRPGSCDCANACTRALALLDAEDARTPTTQVRVARCVEHTCRFGFAIDDRCYAGRPEVSHQIDCARTDAELELAAGDPAFQSVPCHDLIVCSGAASSKPDPAVTSCVQEQQSGVTAP
jgi:hypothetical protein